jgi:hypothetical protein
MTQSDGAIVLILLAAGACLLVVGLVAKMLDLRLRRDGEAIAVRGLISDALDRDPNLFGTSITIVRVRVPPWTGSPVTIGEPVVCCSRSDREQEFPADGTGERRSLPPMLIRKTRTRRARAPSGAAGPP